jgi:hypothetical protein
MYHHPLSLTLKDSISMTIYTLYVKVHRKTGLRYLGQTKKNPNKYLGSGVDWSSHLEKFGDDIDTEILLKTTDWEELKYWGRYYSELWRVVTSMDDFGNKIWANKIPETGGGAGRTKDSYSEKEKKHKSELMMGDKNPMSRPEVQLKKSGANHHMRRPDYDPQTHPMKRPEVIASRSGTKHHRYDHNVYKFINSMTGHEVELTQAEFIKQYNMSQASVSRLVSGEYKKSLGWRLQHA